MDRSPFRKTCPAETLSEHVIPDGISFEVSFFRNDFMKVFN